MEEKALQTIDIRRILSLAPVVDEYALGTEFILGAVSGKRVEKSEAILHMLKYPVRFDGYILFFLKSGHFTLDVNLSSYDIHPNSLLMVTPGNIVKLSAYNEQHIGDAELLFALVSREFLSSIRFDFNKVFQDTLRVWKTPCITLQGDDLDLAEDYFRLTRKILSSRQSNKREIVGSLLTSFTYVTLDVWMRQLEESRAAESASSARATQLFERFLALVTEHHNEERGMAFYADKLCLTPKYLSRLVKLSSGRSAPDWIDSFVILEAKNMLKYSDKPIKEIVYMLHFPNQGVFYKFFKAHTGMTPSEYRKG
ncbi:MAG: helix-turn-helix domain-containing protein [Bacteroidales bacterium]|jgi:AraC-like DNA-binding protein|nr:helix-turn-helix domain-containing protein [Bacteroidales bacterium]